MIANGVGDTPAKVRISRLKMCLLKARIRSCDICGTSRCRAATFPPAPLLLLYLMEQGCALALATASSARPRHSVVGTTVGEESTMRWEELTGDRFAEAVKECEGVCAIALSVVERHGHHLPMGTDTYVGREILTRAAAQEPMIEFPDYIFTQIPEARHLIGTISIDGDLMVKLLDNVCREIARNGCTKIVLVNAHGGNTGLVSLFNMLQLYSPRDYVVYLVQPFRVALSGEVDVPWPMELEGHAGPGETSMILKI